MVKGATWFGSPMLIMSHLLQMMCVRMMMMVVVMMVMATSCMVAVRVHPLEIMESLMSCKKTKIVSLRYLINVTREQSEGITT